MSHSSERQHHRIQYPTAARPQLVVEGRSFEVIDLSEGGMRFRVDEGPPFAVRDQVGGTVRLRRNEAVDVMGVVVRVTGREVAMKLDLGVPLRVIIEEQRFLREHHRGMA